MINDHGEASWKRPGPTWLRLWFPHPRCRRATLAESMICKKFLFAVVMLAAFGLGILIVADLLLVILT